METERPGAASATGTSFHAPATLTLLSVTESAGSPAAHGLTGANKTNGIQYRLRQSVPTSTPAFVARTRDGLDLWIADPVAGGWLAFYREPLGAMHGSLNSRYRAALHASDGSLRWVVDLDRALSRPTDLEIQDVRFEGGELYINEACQSYSREAGGPCSSLVRIDPDTGEVLWRSRPLVSNDIFILTADHLVAGYGFTDEADSVHLVSRATGSVVASHPLDSAHSYLELSGNRLVVMTRRRVYDFRIGR